MKTVLTGYIGFRAPEVDRIWGIWGSYYHIPKATFYLLKGDYKPNTQVLNSRA